MEVAETLPPVQAGIVLIPAERAVPPKMVSRLSGRLLFASALWYPGEHESALEHPVAVLPKNAIQALRGASVRLGALVS